ncbi:hypothetical protein [Vibrio sinus]|uniref:hypothetical protein n=1 Tax=Vibrio sinus TaxID=2946865 RepID=UPI003D7F12C4
MPNTKEENSHWGNDAGTVSYSNDHSIVMIQRTEKGEIEYGDGHAPKKVEHDVCDVFDLKTGCFITTTQDENCYGKWVGKHSFKNTYFDGLTDYDDTTVLLSPKEFLSFYNSGGEPIFSLKSYQACYPVTKDNQKYYKAIEQAYKTDRFSSEK